MNLDLIKLNWKLLVLFLLGKKIETSDFERSYNLLASSYDDDWYKYLDSITSDIFKNLPEIKPKCILDLGCGTGTSTVKIRNVYKDSHIIGLDFSKPMLDQAKRKTGFDKVLFFRNTIEDGVEKFENAQFDLVVASWSLGYCKNKNVYKHLSRILSDNGYLMILTNKDDTLKEVKQSMHYTMLKHNKRIRKVPLHRFPKDLSALTAKLVKYFNVVNSGEGSFSIDFSSKSSVIDWLLNTGILAGYEYILNIRRSEPCKKTYEDYIRSNFKEIIHNYMWILVQKK